MVRTSWLRSFQNTMKQILQSKPPARRTRRGNADRLRRVPEQVELLEQRSMLSVSTLFLQSTGELSIELDSNESVRVSSVSGNLTVDIAIGTGLFTPAPAVGTVASANVRHITILGGDEANTIDLSRVFGADFTSLTTIVVNGLNGHDNLLGSFDLPSSLVGGDGNDTLQGGSAIDTLLGNNGNDSIIAGAGDDLIQAGDGSDFVTDLDIVNAAGVTVLAGGGNDLISLGDGIDTAFGGDGNDTIDGGDGFDSIVGGLGDDLLNGGMGNDTIVGNFGNDSIIGAAGADLIFGDSDDPAIIATGLEGDDEVDGGAGNDTINGGGGADDLNGGSGDDHLESTTFTTTTNDPLPIPVTNVNAGNPVPLANARPTGLATSNVGTTATMTTGNLDGGLIVTVDGTGKFGAFSEVVQPNPINTQIFIPQTVGNPPIAQFKGWRQEGAIYNPLGDGLGFVPDITTIESGVYFRFGTATGIPRILLNEAAGNAQTPINILGTTTEAVSRFNVGTLQFDLTQQVQPQFDLVSINRVGTLLTQTYVVTNTAAVGTPAIDFELVRYLDGDLNFDGRDGLGGTTSNSPPVGIQNGVPDGASDDGGGRLFNRITGDEFLFETEQGGVSSNGTFIGITSKPNPALPPTVFPANRFELSLFPTLRNSIRNGDALKNQIANDANSDGSVDPGQEGNVTLALRNTYSLLPGASGVYTTHTIFGNGRPDQIQFNRGPSTTRDGNDPNDLTDNSVPPIVALSSEPVTIDVVKNDVDVDGTIDFTSVQIDTQPSKGTVEVIGDGRIRYTPDPTSSGTFSFTYTVADNLGSRSIPTLVFVVVNPDPLSDVINGGAGNDTLVGADGMDSLLGGSGNDSIFGGTNQDALAGQAGLDSIIGGGGSDTLNGGGGNDSLSSLPGNVPSLFINDVTVLEGLVTPVSNGNVTATFVITLDRPIEQPVTFRYTVLSGAATVGGINAAGTDVVAATGLLTIEPCETTITLPVQILGDVLAELTETYTVVLSNLVNAQVGKAIGVGQILNNGLMLDTTGGPSLVNATRQFGDQNTVQIAINPIDTTKAVLVTNDRPASFLNALFFGGNLIAAPELGVFISNDGGRSWNPSPTIFDRFFDGVFTVPFSPEARYHPSVAYDRQGSLHVAYVAEPVIPIPLLGTILPGPTVIVYAISRDNGLTFQPQLLTGAAVGNDRPNVAVGPDAANLALDAVYVTYHTGVGVAQAIVMQGAQVPPALPNLPAIQTPVPQFAAAAPGTVTNVNAPNFPIATVGPAGEVAVTWQTPSDLTVTSFQGPSTVNFAFDNNGRLGGLVFPSITTITSSNVGSNDLIPALNPFAINFPIFTNFLAPTPPNEQAYASPLLAYDRSGGPNDGRLYLVYVDEQANESDNLDIFLRFSDNDGTTFSDPVRVNDDLGFNSQFHPSLAVDQSNGVVVVGWYDARNDFFGGTADTDIGNTIGFFGSLTGVNTDVEYFVTASYNGGTSFMPNVQVSNGSTSAIRNFTNFSLGGLLGNYTGIAVAKGVILAAWADNSNSTGDNPDGNFNTDTYVARLTESSTGMATASAFTSQTDPADLLLGGDGEDTLNGGDSGDTLNGQEGADLLFGGCGGDSLLGGTGMDTLSGGFDEDTLDGQGGADVLIGNQDNDTYLWGSSSGGNDTVVGDSGFDTTSVTGTNGPDSFVIGQNGKNLTVTVGNKGTLTVTHPAAAMSVIVNALGSDDLITVGHIDKVVPLVLTANGGDGNDVVTAKNSLIGGNRLALEGGNGNDTLIGSKGNDTLRGGAGNDNLRSDDGNDLLLGGSGIDVINGQGGNDTLFGDEIADTVSGANSGSGDSMLGGDGNDVMSGGGGNDTMNGEDGDDSLRGNDGADVISGGMGNDALFGDISTDVLSGGSGNDTLDGGRNDDTLNGNSGSDRILGDHGNDFINGGDGDNTILGGDGNDTIRTGSGNDAIFGGDGDDLINTEAGNDTIIGGDGADTMLGGAGNDVLLGRDGADYIDGQAGIDIIAGNEGADTLIAEPGEINELFALASLNKLLLASLGITP